MTWVRTGYCCRCGDCCKGDPYSSNPELRSEAMKREPPVEGYCPLYEIVNGQGCCTGRDPADPYYAGGCSTWPENPDTIKNHPNCTYKFEWVD